MTQAKQTVPQPRFRAEHIGSLLRPSWLFELRQRFKRGEATRDELTAAENRAIAETVAFQEQLGLRVVTDGEFRRESYHTYFFRQLGDLDIELPPDTGAGRWSQPRAVIKSRVKWSGPVHVNDLQLLQSVTRAVPKITIPGPCTLHFRGGNEAVTAHAYRDVDEFWLDIIDAFRSELKALAAAGCTYVQIDETSFAKFGDPDVQTRLAARGDDWSALIDTYIDVTNRVLRDIPETLTIGMHLCRGNRSGHWHAEGGYDAVAERLFNKLDIPLFLLEYDSPRAGTFTPLRLLPAGKSVVLGLVSTKEQALEAKDELKRKIEAASKFVSLERLAVSPQCGFAGVETGSPMTPQIQEQKLSLVVDLAREVWGSA